MAEEQLKEFDALRLLIASPEEILSWSHGEVQKPETINYRTQKPEKGGLFCERIFGPTRDWECYCGKYKKIRYKGIVCEKCGVEVTRSSVRRERMGHINLASPCCHIWFLRSVPSRIGLVLDLSVRDLERVIYFDSHIVIKINESKRIAKLKKLEQEFKNKKQAIRKDFNQKIQNLEKKLSSKLPSEVEEQIKLDIDRFKKEEERVLKDLEDEHERHRELLQNIQEMMVIKEEDFQEINRFYPDVFETGIGAEAIYDLLSNVNLEDLRKNLRNQLKRARGAKRKHLIKRLRVIESFIRNHRRPEWMVLKVLPVIPPDLRPMVQLDGGRFASADLNDLYRRVINRNNRLKRLIEIGAPEIIKRNEKRMLQEAVDALIDNSARGARAVTTGAARRKLRSLSDILRGKQGRFRQNLLGKRVDYSGRSVIVIGPSLKLNECGVPKVMALELFKPFVIADLIKKEVAHNVRAAIRLIERKEAIVWDTLESVVERYYVLLNRAPTLHRLGIQAFRPILIEGEAIQLHPLVCAAFNADFDGDQMAIHVPLSQKAQEEAYKIMLSTVNLLKPADGSPITLPSEDMVLGCYYITSFKEKARGEGKIFKDREEALTAFYNGVLAINAKIKVRIDGKLIETCVGRIIFNEALPSEFGFINEAITDKAIKRIISECYFNYGHQKTVALLDKIKTIGFHYATYSGLTIAIDDIKIPSLKNQLIKEAEAKIEEIRSQYKQGLLTEYERYLSSIEVWMNTREAVSELLEKELDKDNPLYTMVFSGARGNLEQIVQMGGMKGLVVNPAGDIIQLPIISSFKEGFNVLEYFIASHGSRKGKADTALRTSDAGYLTRRLVDVSQDVIVLEEDCGTSKGFVIDQEMAEDTGMEFEDKILGRFAAEDILDEKGNVLVKRNEEINEAKIKLIRSRKIKKVKIRSVLTCETKFGVCAKCYGRDLARGTLVKLGEPVGVIAAQSIGEPGTQLTMRTFHRGGVAGEDITSGLPRVEELFEARTPKGQAILAPADGIVRIKEEWDKKILKLLIKNPLTKVYKIPRNFQIKVKNKASVRPGEILAKSKDKEIKTSIEGVVKLEGKKVIVEGVELIEKQYPVSPTASILVKDKAKVKRGDQLTSGALNLQELLRLKGQEAVQRYLISEIQKIYASQGPTIADKHLEIIIRKMFSKVRIKSPGDTDLLVGEILDRREIEEINEKIKKKGKKPALYESLLLGITKAALYTDSFLSAASFQETTRSLVEAAITGKVDNLRGLKENVIIGRLIPAGTGFRR